MNANADAGGQGFPPPPYEGHGAPPSMADVTASLNALAMTAQQTQAQLGQLAQAMQQHIHIAQQPRPVPLPKLESVRFAVLDVESGDLDEKITRFCAWEAAIKANVISFNGLRADLPLRQLVAAIIGSLDGKARLMSQGVNPNHYAENYQNNPNLAKEVIFDNFFTKLSNILLGSSVPEKALALFQKRRQGKDEDIHPYHAELGILYRKAFPQTWEDPENQRALINHFLENLSDIHMAYDANVTQNRPATYAEALNMLESRQGVFDRFKLAYGSRAAGVAAGAPRLLGGARGGGQGGQGGPQPMDCDAFGRQARGRGGARNARGERGRPVTAIRNQGRGQVRGRDQGPNRGQSRGRGQGGPNNRGNPANQRRDRRCYACNKEGHLARNCPSRVGAIEPEEVPEQFEEYEYEETEEDYNEEDDWSPEEHPVGAVGVGPAPKRRKMEEGEVIYEGKTTLGESIEVIKTKEGNGMGRVGSKDYELDANTVLKIQTMIAKPELFDKKPETYREAIQHNSNVSFHPQADESAIVFIDGKMKTIPPANWKEMKKTFGHFVQHPLEYSHDEVERMVKRSAETGNCNGRSIEDAC